MYLDKRYEELWLLTLIKVWSFERKFSKNMFSSKCLLCKMSLLNLMSFPAKATCSWCLCNSWSHRLPPTDVRMNHERLPWHSLCRATSSMTSRGQMWHMLNITSSFSATLFWPNFQSLREKYSDRYWLSMQTSTTSSQSCDINWLVICTDG
jgi:hypothetical protein